MNHIKLFILLLFSVFTLHSQDFYIDFKASGTLTTLTSVLIENLTQSTLLTVSGDDTLHLIGTVGVLHNNYNDRKLLIYPNPSKEASTFELYSEVSTNVEIFLYDVVGKHLLHLNQVIHKGSNIFEISGLTSGYYQLIVSAETWRKSASFVSLNTGYQKPKIQVKTVMPNQSYAKTITNTSGSVKQMSYAYGDLLRLIGYSGNVSVIVEDIPNSSKTIEFVFTIPIFICGSTLTDTRDGNEYPTVQIGNQCWMAKNLAYLPSVVDPSLQSESEPYYYVYGYNDTCVATAKTTDSYNTYGVLYNWSAAMNGALDYPGGVKGICPEGWHLPRDVDWSQLTDNLGGNLVAGGKLKEVGTANWNSPNAGATNETGFTALPGGCCNTNGVFNHVGIVGYWWSTTSYISQRKAFYIYTGYGYTYFGHFQSRNGFSVRCVINN